MPTPAPARVAPAHVAATRDTPARATTPSSGTQRPGRPAAFDGASASAPSSIQAATDRTEIASEDTSSTAQSTSIAPRSRSEKTDAADVDGERLHKLIARAGLASRRAAEEMIGEGRVVVNGHVIREMGFKANPDADRIVVDGHPLQLPSGPATVIALHKPRGVMTTKDDPEGRPTVMGLLPVRLAPLHPVGRLDFETAGLLLLTDDGALTQKLTHPSHGVEKVYQARVRGNVALETVRKLESGIFLEDGKTAPCRVRVRAQTERNALLEITLHEGRNRQVRRMLEAVGYPVSSLRRIRFGPIDLVGLAPGEHRVLLPGEVHLLHKAADTKSKSLRSKPRAAKPKPKPTRTTKAIAASAPAAKAQSSKIAPPKSPAASATGATGATAARKPAPSRSAENTPHRASAHPLVRRIENRWDS